MKDRYEQAPFSFCDEYNQIDEEESHTEADKPDVVGRGHAH